MVHLVLCLQETCPETISDQARQDLFSWVRQDFHHICAQQSSKLRKIIHDTISKLYGNTPLRKDREAILSLAIPACTSAICDIVSHSSNDVFRQRCFQAMQATSTRELSDKLSQGLASLGRRSHDQLLAPNQRWPLSQPRFPDGGGDEAGGHRAPSDGTNQATRTPQHTPRQTLPEPKGLLPPTESDEDRDFDLLDETGPDCLSSLLPQDPHPPSNPTSRATSSTSHPQTPSSSSSSSSLSSTSAANSSSKLPAKISSSFTSFRGSVIPRSPSLPSSIDPHLHDNPRPPMKPGEGVACGEDVQMMQEVLCEEVGGDWFESLTGAHDWLGKEL